MTSKEPPQHTEQPRGSFAFDVMKMASAPFVTQVLGIIILPVIARCYTPDDYGVFAVFGSISSPLIVFACLGYHLSIMLAKDEEEAANIVGLCLFCSIFISMLAILVFSLAGDFISDLLNVQAIKYVFWLVPVNIFLTGIFMILRYWNLRKMQFGCVARANIARFLTNNSIILIAVILWGNSGANLILGALLGAVASPVVLGWQVWQESRNKIFSRIRWRKMLSLSKRYRKFPLYIVWVDLLSRFAVQVPIYLLSGYFSQMAVGYYSLGIRLLNMPMSLLGNSIGEVFFQRDTQSDNESSEARLKKLFGRLISLSMLPFFLLGITGKDLFIVGFGQAWAEAGVYAQILSFSIFIKFITIPANYLAISLEKQEYSFVFNIANVGLSVIALFIGCIRGDIYLGFMLLSLFTGISYGVFGFWLMNLAGLKLSVIIDDLLKSMVFSFPAVMMTSVAKWGFHTPPVVTLLISCSLLIANFVVIFKKDKILQQLVIGHFAKKGLMRTSNSK